jgi:hypothetical protein
MAHSACRRAISYAYLSADQLIGTIDQMAKSSNISTVIKLLTVEQISQALAEWTLVNSGKSVTGFVRVDAQFMFNPAKTELKGCRVEITT